MGGGRDGGHVHSHAEDQLKPWNDWWRKHLAGEEDSEKSRDAWNVRRRLLQRVLVRNRREAQLPDGTTIRGYGDLTGETSALALLDIREVPVNAGMRFVLATDSFRLLLKEDTSHEGDWSGVLGRVRDLEPAAAADALLQLAVCAQVRAHDRLSDTTVVVIDLD